MKKLLFVILILISSILVGCNNEDNDDIVRTYYFDADEFLGMWGTNRGLFYADEGYIVDNISITGVVAEIEHFPSDTTPGLTIIELETPLISYRIYFKITDEEEITEAENYFVGDDITIIGKISSSSLDLDIVLIECEID